MRRILLLLFFITLSFESFSQWSYKTVKSDFDGTYKRDAFSREIKKMVNEHVLAPYNKQKTSADEILEAKDVLLLEYVTQSG